MPLPPAAEGWLHDAIEVRPSTIAGRGLFARAPIPAGTAVSRLGGRLVSSADLRQLVATADADAPARNVDSIIVAEDVHLVLPPDRPGVLGNHSCAPNLWWTDEYTLTAMRDIAAGEEVTNDYATSAGDAEYLLRCMCGTTRCRGMVTADDWRIPELQARYAEHWVPALLARIRASRGGDDQAS